MSAGATAPPVLTRLRLPAGRWRAAASSLGAVLCALVIGGVLIALAGGSPLGAYAAMVDGAFGNPFAVGRTLTGAVPLLIIGLGIAMAFRGRVYNIGAEGQLYIGALAAGALVIAIGDGPSVVLWLAAAVAGTIGGAAWGAIVGGLRARWGVNEVITSLLLNYVAILIFTYVVRQPLKDPGAAALQGRALPDAAALPDLPEVRAHVGLILALALVPVVGWVLSKTPFGFRIGMLGHNAEAAEVAGVSRGRMVVSLMLLSGGLAGIAGAIQTLGVAGRLDASLSQGLGFTAIVVALIGRLQAGGVLLGALFLAALSSGGQAMSVTEGLPYGIVLAIQGAFVVFLLIADRLARN